MPFFWQLTWPNQTREADAIARSFPGLSAFGIVHPTRPSGRRFFGRTQNANRRAHFRPSRLVRDAAGATTAAPLPAISRHRSLADIPFAAKARLPMSRFLHEREPTRCWRKIVEMRWGQSLRWGRSFSSDSVHHPSPVCNRVSCPTRCPPELN